MSFAFNFETPVELLSGVPETKDNVEGGDSDGDQTQEVCRYDKKQEKVKPAMELDQFYKQEIFDKLVVKTMDFGDCILRVVDTKALEDMVLTDKTLTELLETSQVFDAVSSHSDLVSGAYEGGLKVWECSLDLAEFLSLRLGDISQSIKGKSFLELGCGAGLPGLYCLKNGAKEVHFQDYNEEVLRLLTCSNVKLCTENDIDQKKCRFFAGDWSSFSELALKECLKYDVILTAETIYNVENYSKLHSLFETVLHEDGCILLAAKSYYFGVGGSTEGFLEFVGSKGIFSSDIVYSVSKGVPRYIVLLKRIKNDSEKPRDKRQDSQREAMPSLKESV